MPVMKAKEVQRTRQTAIVMDLSDMEYEAGQILTNNHVVNGSQSLTVTLADKKQYKAKVIGTDPRNDLALIEIKAGRKLPFLRLGDSDNLQVGQKVLAIGNPFGLEGTLTTGIVSSR